MKIIKDILKELKILTTSKDLLVLLLLGPIFLTIYIGCVYSNSYVEKIPMVVLDEDNSSLSRILINNFKDCDRFDVKYSAKDKFELQNYIDKKKAFIGVLIPNDFSKEISKLKSSPVLIIVDGTNMVVSNNAIASASSIIQTNSSQILVKVLESKNVLQDNAIKMASAFTITERMIYDPTMSYMNYLIFGLLAVFIQQIMLSSVGSSVIKSIDEGALCIKSIIIKILLCSLLCMLSSSICIEIISTYFHVIIRGKIFFAILFSLLFCFSISCPAIILGLLIKDKTKFMQVSYMLSMPTFICCGYIWPLYLIPDYLVSTIKMIWPLIYFAKSFSQYLIKGTIPLENILSLVFYTIFWGLSIIVYMNYRSKKKNLNCTCN